MTIKLLYFRVKKKHFHTSFGIKCKLGNRLIYIKMDLWATSTIVSVEDVATYSNLVQHKHEETPGSWRP